ncbi:MAG: hypothetical protein ACPGVT_12600 [Maricaulaceae bacterium]
MFDTVLFHAFLGAVAGVGLSVVFISMLKMERNSTASIAMPITFMIMGVMGGFLTYDIRLSPPPSTSTPAKDAPSKVAPLEQVKTEKPEETAPKPEVKPKPKPEVKPKPEKLKKPKTPLEAVKIAYFLQAEGFRYLAEEHHDYVCNTDPYWHVSFLDVALTKRSKKPLKWYKKTHELRRHTRDLPDAYLVKGGRIRLDLKERFRLEEQSPSDFCRTLADIHDYILALPDDDILGLYAFDDSGVYDKKHLPYKAKKYLYNQVEILPMLLESNPDKYNEIVLGYEEEIATDTLSNNDINYISNVAKKTYQDGIDRASPETIRKFNAFQIYIYEGVRVEYPQACTLRFNGLKKDRQRLHKVLPPDYRDRLWADYKRFIVAPKRIALQASDMENGQWHDVQITRQAAERLGVRETNPPTNDGLNNIPAHQKMCDLMVASYTARNKLLDDDLMDVWDYFYASD